MTTKTEELNTENSVCNEDKPRYNEISEEYQPRKMNELPENFYDSCSVQTKNKTEQKPESRSHKKMFYLFNIILLVLILIAIGGCYGLVGKLMSETQHEKLSGYILSDDNWIIPFNGYQYKLIKESLNWNSARSYCQSYGGDLASQGFQSLHIRKTVREAIEYTGYVWIGLSYQFSEERWRWLSSTGTMNGDYATDDISLWYRDPPSSSSNSFDCAVLYFSSAYAYPYYSSYGFYFLCEKQI